MSNALQKQQGDLFLKALNVNVEEAVRRAALRYGVQTPAEAPKPPAPAAAQPAPAAPAPVNMTP
ncbi:MAG: hypothetical protein K2X11_21420 [Acetobacteraceae bacterium]|nr:hypothetical protein [Acetobacteraceae bacterium]